MSHRASCGFVYLLAEAGDVLPAAVKIGKAWWQRGERRALASGRTNAALAPLARRHSCLQSCNPRRLVLLGAWTSSDELVDHLAATAAASLVRTVERLQKRPNGKAADREALRREAANTLWEADIHAILTPHRETALDAGECIGGSEWFPGPGSPSCPVSLFDIEAAISRLPGVARLPGVEGTLAEKGGYETEPGLSSWKTGGSFDLFLLLDGPFCKMVGTAYDYRADAVAGWYNTGNPRRVTARRFRLPGADRSAAYARAAALIEDLRTHFCDAGLAYTDKPFSGSGRRTWTPWLERDADIMAARLTDTGFVEMMEAPAHRRARTSRWGG
ncbi:hypothetical protein FHW79_005330 [Azospirillum sp. OGB3]|uniref:hypothetical protein n=1 Tax=Azospirillum sp. OGB3 TaxID=2587012 RepID=UPI0016064EEC|nr:hypothetical protein [Azospirillum sp. OGB3]MBB3267665.1 hypothetical protein [Azospirillum sp. OGB3]